MSSNTVRPPRLSDRAFGLTFSIVFFIIAAVGWVVFDRILTWAIIVTSGFTLLTLVAPGILLPLNRLWGVFAHKLGAFNNALLLGLFFFLFIVPFGAVMRLFGKDPMMRTIDQSAPSYWATISRHAEPDTFADMF